MDGNINLKCPDVMITRYIVYYILEISYQQRDAAFEKQRLVVDQILTVPKFSRDQWELDS